MELILQLLIGLLCVGVWVRADLTFKGPTCGMYTCKEQQFCSEIDSQCKDCSSICDPDKHNFEEKLCVRDCQDYLHDARYVRIDQNGRSKESVVGNQNGDIPKLYRLVTATLTLVILVIIALFLVASYKLFRWAKSNDIKVNNFTQHFKKNRESNDLEGKTNGGNRKDLRLTIASPIAQSEITTPGTLSTSISRRPAEDSALDYAYDNHAMSGTPSPHSGKAARESDF